MRSIALANQKGGVGKTTTAVHLAHGLAIAGDTAVILDLDPQGNATLSVQGMAETTARSADEEPPAGPFAALAPLAERLWILPSPGAYRNIDRRTVPDTAKLRALTEALAEHGADWLIVDCPPRMDAWGWAGLELCQQVLLPVQAEFFAMHGLGQMLQTLRQARKKFAGRADLLGVLPTLVDGREEISREVLDDLRENLGEQVCQAAIYRDSTFVEAASHGRTLFDYRIDAKGTLCYASLVREVRHGRA